MGSRGHEKLVPEIPVDRAGRRKGDAMSGTLRRSSTISDIARLSGVSNRTVSRVINRSSKVGEATRQKVQRIIDETSYRPNAQARGLAGGRSYLLGLIYDNPDAHFIDQAPVSYTHLTLPTNREV